MVCSNTVSQKGYRDPQTNGLGNFSIMDGKGEVKSRSLIGSEKDEFNLPIAIFPKN